MIGLNMIYQKICLGKFGMENIEDKNKNGLF